MERKEINVLEYFYLLYKGRKFIFFNFIILCTAAAIISMIMPKMYKSATVLMPPREAKKGFGFAEALASQVTTLRLGTQGSPSDLFIGILKSQTLKSMMVDKFNLVKYYGVKNRDVAMMSLKGATDISLTKEGLIRIEYEDPDPVQAAMIANMYVAMLDSVNQSISQRGSRERADFIEAMMNENTVTLKQAELDLKKFQFETKAISPYQQQRVSLQVSAQLEMDLMNMENELKQLRAKSFTETNPLVQDMEKKIQLREEQVHNMRFGTDKESRETLFVPLQQAPGLTIEYNKLYRRIDSLGDLDRLLRNQYEESRLEQVNTTSTISILDRATPPIRHSKPKRFLIVIVAGAASLFFSMVTIITLDFFQRLAMTTPENRQKLAQLSRLLRIDQ